MDQYKIHSIQALKTMPIPQQATEILHQLVQATRLLLVRRQWKVKSLQEFYPKQGTLLGLNINAGQCIKIRLRCPRNSQRFLPFESLLGTLVHELVHNAIGAHSFEFYSLVDQLEAEVQQDLLSKRTTTNTLPPDSKGQKLGGRKVDDIKQNILYEAALKRQNNNNSSSSSSSGVYRLRDYMDNNTTNNSNNNATTTRNYGGCLDNGEEINNYRDEVYDEDNFLTTINDEIFSLDNIDPTLLQYCFPVENNISTGNMLMWSCDICLEQNKTIETIENFKMICTFCGHNNLSDGDIVVHDSDKKNVEVVELIDDVENYSPNKKQATSSSASRKRSKAAESKSASSVIIVDDTDNKPRKRNTPRQIVDLIES